LALLRETEGIGPMKSGNLPNGDGAKSYGNPKDEIIKVFHLGFILSFFKA